MIEKARRAGKAPYLLARWPLLLDYLREAGVQMLTETKLKGVTDKGVVITDKEEKERLVEADTVILALERIPNDELQKKLEGKGPELYSIGDCVEPKHIYNAIHSGYRIAREI